MHQSNVPERKRSKHEGVSAETHRRGKFRKCSTHHLEHAIISDRRRWLKATTTDEKKANVINGAELALEKVNRDLTDDALEKWEDSVDSIRSQNRNEAVLSVTCVS